MLYFNPRALALTVSLWAMAATVSYGQTNTSADQPLSQGLEKITLKTIDLAIRKIDDSEELDDSTQSRLKNYLTQAKSELDAETTQLSNSARFRTWIENAESDIEQARKQKEAAPPAYDLVAAENFSLNQLLKDRFAVELQLTDVKKQLAVLLPESQQRVYRMGQIPSELVEAQAALKEVESQRSSFGQVDEPAIMAQTRIILLRARQQKLQAIISALENERRAYVAQAELPRLRIDLLTTESKQLESDIEKLVVMITESRKKDANSQLQDAETLLKSLPESLKPFATLNIKLANRRITLASEIQEAINRREPIAIKLKRWEEDFKRSEKRVATASSERLGLMLVEKRSQLPSISKLRLAIANSASEIRESQLELFELEDRRNELSDIQAEIEGTVAKLSADDRNFSDDLDAELRNIFILEIQILDSLLKDANRYFNVRIGEKDEQLRLSEVIQQYKDFIDRQVFWTRSAEPMSWEDFSRSQEAIGWLFNGNTWSDIQRRVVRQVKGNLVFAIFLGACLLLVITFSTRIQNKLEELGNVAAGISCTTFSPTIHALVLTVLLAGFLPGLAWLGKWSLTGAVEDPARSIGLAFKSTAIWLLVVEFAKQILHPKGLAESHFDWTSISSGTTIKKHLFWLLYGGTPLVWLGTVFLRCGDPVFLSSIGRICLVAFLVLIATLLFRSGRRGAIARVEENPGGPFRRFGKVGYLLTALVPIGFAAFAIAGYQLTINQLTHDILLTIGFIFGLCVIRALLFRWVRVRRRRIRWQQMMNSRKAINEEEGETTDLEAIAAKEELTDLVAMDSQARRFISVVFFGIGLVGLYAIWLEVFPVLSSILSTAIYHVEGSGGSSRPITVGILLLTVLIVYLLVVVWRSLPGLVDVTLVDHYGIRQSTRYAISTLLQYASTIIAVLLVCASLGWTWGKAQWLVAALGVGLGFGLQEIVANFVCGILLLFERPIRVGDFVTLGDSEGVVTRIRSRATTVRNWDRQEVIIPNKELITGRIINWTLDDQVIRIIIKVGIAYGSDTNHARELLNMILHENPNVLEDPRPIVAFDEFGDSTLNFTIRAFLENIDERWETIHSLNTCIVQRFAEEGIEIAFPQRDLHLRSVASELGLNKAVD